MPVWLMQQIESIKLELLDETTFEQMKERKPNRLEGYDYSKDNLYFVTSCTRDRIHFFGEIKNHKMILNACGEIARNQWNWLAKQYPYVKSHAFIVMPNHIHGILEINRDVIDTDISMQKGSPKKNESHVGTGRDLSLHAETEGFRRHRYNHNPIKIKSLSQLMGAYKTTSSKEIHLLGVFDFAWQRSFYDHIIRNSESFEKIKAYIHTNPKRWDNDRFGPINSDN